MGDVGDDFRAFKSWTRARRDALGAPCLECMRDRPRAIPKVLLPGQRCRYGHQDPRSPMLVVEYNKAHGQAGMSNGIEGGA